jgi:hypothetical protein
VEERLREAVDHILVTPFHHFAVSKATKIYSCFTTSMGMTIARSRK